MTTPGASRTPSNVQLQLPPCSAHRLLSWVGSSPPHRAPTLHFALCTMGDPGVASPIPLLAGIKAHTLCEENVHLRHMQRLIKALQSVTISLLSRACLYPPPSKAARLFSCSLPPRCPKPSLRCLCGLLCPRTPARNTRRYEHPLDGVPGLSGRGFRAPAFMLSLAALFLPHF
jgi:hypothetical protein